MSEEKLSFIDEIKDRKVIPYFITYLGGCWAIIQLVDWYVKQNMFSPHWTQMVFYAFIIIIPSVLVFLFALGNSGKKFSAFHYRFIGTNVILALGILGFLFRQKPMQKVAEKVVVVNEEGVEEERFIPNQALNRRVIIFPFESEKNELQIRTGLPLLASLDIEQNPNQFSIPSINLKSRYQKYNRDINEDIPFSVQREIASDLVFRPIHHL